MSIHGSIERCCTSVCGWMCFLSSLSTLPWQQLVAVDSCPHWACFCRKSLWLYVIVCASSQCNFPFFSIDSFQMHLKHFFLNWTGLNSNNLSWFDFFFPPRSSFSVRKDFDETTSFKWLQRNEKHIIFIFVCISLSLGSKIQRLCRWVEEGKAHLDCCRARTCPRQST